MRNTFMTLLLLLLALTSWAQGRETVVSETYKGQTYAITRQVDKSRSRRNADGTVFYATRYTVEYGGRTYSVPQEMYIAHDGDMNDAGHWASACMAVDVENDITYFYCFTKAEDAYYGMNDHLYRLTNSSASHITLFEGMNTGWHSFFEYIDEVGLVLFSFAYGGYYVTVTYEGLQWRMAVLEQMMPDDFIEMRKEVPTIYFYGDDGTVDADEPEPEPLGSALVIWHTNGDITQIALDDEPVTTYDNGTLVVSTQVTTVSLPLEEVKRFTYQMDETAIASIAGHLHRVKCDGKNIYFSHFNRDTAIQVYSTAGVLVMTTEVKAGEDGMVSLQALPHGAYVVKANGITYKIVKQ